MQKRKYPNKNISQISFQFVEKESIQSNWFLSYCLMVSDSEKYIVRQIYQNLNKVNDKKLDAELRLCIFQETQHANSHKFFNEIYLANKPYAASSINFSRFINFTILERLFSSSLKLSIASATEQLNAEISYFGLDHLNEISKDLQFKKLLAWHFIEEIEHRDCVYDLMNKINVSQTTKFLGALLALFSFYFWITLNCILLSHRYPKLWLQLPMFIKPQGLFRRLLSSTRRYLSNAYHPSHEIKPLNFKIWQQYVSVFEW